MCMYVHKFLYWVLLEFLKKKTYTIRIATEHITANKLVCYVYIVGIKKFQSF